MSWERKQPKSLSDDPLVVVRRSFFSPNSAQAFIHILRRKGILLPKSWTGGAGSFPIPCVEAEDEREQHPAHTHKTK